MAYIRRTYQVSKQHDVAIKRAAKKLKVSSSEVVRRRLRPTWEEMLKELEEDMKHSKYITMKNIMQ